MTYDFLTKNEWTFDDKFSKNWQKFSIQSTKCMKYVIYWSRIYVVRQKLISSKILSSKVVRQSFSAKVVYFDKKFHSLNKVLFVKKGVFRQTKFFPSKKVSFVKKVFFVKKGVFRQKISHGIIITFIAMW